MCKRSGINICVKCEEKFTAFSGRAKYCPACIAIMSICPKCGNIKNDFRKNHCSNSCAGKDKVPNAGSFKGNWVGEKQCKKCFLMFEAKSGITKYCPVCVKYLSVCPMCFGLKSMYDSFCSNSCAGKWKYENSAKIRVIIAAGRVHPNRAIACGNAQRGKPKYHLRGDKNPNWRGGTYTKQRQKDMGRVEYANWRKAVYTRDKYTCQNCDKKGVILNADHVLPYSLFPELVYSVPNGKTLCVSCHKNTPTYGEGVKKLKREEFLIF